MFRCRAYSQTVTQPLSGLRLGLVREHFGPGLDAEVEAAVREAFEVYESLGAKVKEISLPHGKYGVATYYIIAPCEASSNLARYDGVHYGYRTDDRQNERPPGRAKRSNCRPPATKRRWRSSTIRWCECTANRGPRVSGRR